MRSGTFVGLAIVATLLSGCAISLPFNNRTTFEKVSEARAVDARAKGPVKLSWDPPGFPERIDIQGASGFVGGISQTRIPTGVALASRVTELLDASVGLSPTSSKWLMLRVLHAESKFEYSAGIFNVTPAIDVGVCNVKMEFILPGKAWQKEFTARYDDPAIGGKSATAILERAWDDVALQIVKEIASGL